MSTNPKADNLNLVKDVRDVQTKNDQLLNAPYGQQGAIHIIATDKRFEGEFYCLIAIRDDVKLDASATDVNWTEGQAINGEAMWESDFMMPVGLPFYGDFKSVGLVPVAGEDADAPKLVAYRK
jgi:hypothetical protein